MADRVFEAMSSLAACLCVEVGSQLCFCGVLPGAAVANDYITCDKECGMAYVQLGAATPASGVAVADLNPGNCSSGIGLEIEMGIFRCYPTMDEDGNPPTMDEAEDATRIQIADMMAMRRAVHCCNENKDFIMGIYTPIGPEGNSVGGVWSLTLLVV